MTAQHRDPTTSTPPGPAAPTAVALQRLTTEYVEVEDRLRIAGETTDGQTVVLWMTQRLMLRLVPALLKWLQPEDMQQHAQLARQEFAQDEARSRLAPQPAVSASAPIAHSRVDTVDVTLAPTWVQLTFHGDALHAPASLVMQAVPLRQWLGIVHQQFVRAQWPLHVWPAWMDGHRRGTAGDTLSPVLH